MTAEDGEDFARRGMDDLRGRHAMFRMPTWMSEDEDVSNLATRMSHAPHFATMGRRGGPWRERRSSGGSAMSATSEDDSCDAAATDKSSQCSGGSTDNPSQEIPIRLEAPAPPSSTQHHQQEQQQQQQENEPVAPLASRIGGVRKNTQYPVRTTSAVDASDHSDDVPRTTRCASAPPEMADQAVPQDSQTPPTQQRFVSKISITPQAPQTPEPQPQPKAPSPTKDPRLAQIEAIRASVEEFRSKVDVFTGTKNREFLYLDEMLTRALLKLDNIDPDGRDDVRMARRAVIKDINASISLLEAKASETETKLKAQEPVAETMDTEARQQQEAAAEQPTEAGTQQPVQEAAKQEQPSEPGAGSAAPPVVSSASAGNIDKKSDSASGEKMETEPQEGTATSTASQPEGGEVVT
ncbi:BAG domain-containing protein Samui-like, partial [Homarus americanus]